MNAGARLDDIVHAVQAPAHLLDRPYLKPVYDEPEFVVRNLWRLYGGWYDGNPANLKPRPDAVLAAEVAALAGGAGRGWPSGRSSWPPPATCAWPATSPRWRRWRRPTTPPSTPRGPRCSASGPRSERSTMSKGVFSWAEQSARATRTAVEAD